MARIIAFAGSPREKGHCWRLLRELQRAAEAKGAEVKTYNLNDPGFRGCQGCFHCRTNPECSVKDILTPFYGEIAEANAVVIASPIYFADVTGQTMMWLDRMFPMLDGTAFRPRHPGKKAVTIFSQGDGEPERFRPAINRLHGFLKTFGWDVVDSLVCAGVSARGFVMPEDLLKRTAEIGAALAENPESMAGGRAG